MGGQWELAGRRLTKREIEELSRRLGEVYERGKAKERAQIVAWLPQWADDMRYCSPGYIISRLIDWIARGEHAKAAGATNE